MEEGRNGNDKMDQGNDSPLSIPFCIVLTLRTMVMFHVSSKINSSNQAECGGNPKQEANSNPTLLQIENITTL